VIRPLAFGLLLLGAAGFALAQETSTAPAPPAESDLVKAAQSAKSQRAGKKSKKKVITNADVKRAKAKLIVTSKPPMPVVTAKGDEKGPMEKADELYHLRKAAEEKLTVSEKRVTELERELNIIEQSYYNSTDPNYRDNVIAKQFDQTKRQLAEARRDLADARDTLSATDRPPQP
jgi:hypothetical protein